MEKYFFLLGTFSFVLIKFFVFGDIYFLIKNSNHFCARIQKGTIFSGKGSSLAHWDFRCFWIWRSKFKSHREKRFIIFLFPVKLEFFGEYFIIAAVSIFPGTRLMYSSDTSWGWENYNRAKRKSTKSYFEELKTSKFNPEGTRGPIWPKRFYLTDITKDRNHNLDLVLVLVGIDDNLPLYHLSYSIF